MDFKELEKQDKPVFDRFFQEYPPENSHCNFTNLFMWRKPCCFRWTIENDVLYMMAKWQGKQMALQPYGPANRMNEAVAKLLKVFDNSGFPVLFSGLEESFANVLHNYKRAKFVVELDRDNADYVYTSESLITLGGRKLHAKKNHLNSFKRSYPEAEYLPITKEIITQCKLELNNWYKQRMEDNQGDYVMTCEREAIMEILNDFDYFQLKGGAIRLDKRIVAFTFGEQLNPNTAVIHVEKADPSLRGAFTAINQGFAEHEWSQVEFINREEDMGLEGLRQAKESYKPIKMIDKYIATLA